MVLGHDEQPVKGSPMCIKALAARMDVRTCKLAGEGLNEATAGTPTSFDITPLDRFGNQCATAAVGVDAFELELRQRDHPRSDPIIGSVECADDGIFVGRYKVVRAGQYDLHVKHRGLHLHGSPFGLVVFPAPTQTSSCLRRSHSWYKTVLVSEYPLPLYFYPEALQTRVKKAGVLVDDTRNTTSTVLQTELKRDGTSTFSAQ